MSSSAGALSLISREAHQQDTGGATQGADLLPLQPHGRHAVPRGFGALPSPRCRRAPGEEGAPLSLRFSMLLLS